MVEEEEVEEKRREKEKRDHSYSQIVALAPVLSSDLPLCFQFHIHMQKSSLGNLTFLPPPLSLPLFPSSLFLASLLHSLLLIPSCSQFAFSISKRFEASTSHRIPIPLLQDWTLGLLTFLSPLYISPYCVINPQHSLPTWPCLSRSVSFSTGCIVLAWRTGFWTGLKWIFCDHSLLGLSLSLCLTLLVKPLWARHRHQTVTWYRWNKV